MSDTLTLPFLPFGADVGAGSKNDSPQLPPIVRHFDEAFANTLARLESYNKHLYRPNTYLHKWWARRCGSTFRLILKHLTDNPERQDYYLPGGLEGKTILDPMMGGGTTLHEAIRLGANVIGVDIDPIPVLQARASLSRIPLELLEEGFRYLYKSLFERIGHLFETSCPECGKTTAAQFTLWALQQWCKCGAILSVDSFILRQGKEGRTLAICPNCWMVGSGAHSCSGSSGAGLLVEKHKKQCARCFSPYKEDLAVPFYARYKPFAVLGNCERHGLFFRCVSDEDLTRIGQADSARASLPFDPKDFRVSPGPKSDDLLRRGVTNYLDLFSSRQLLYLHEAIRVLKDLDPLVRLNLALLVSTSLEFNSMLCGYKGADRRRPGAIRHTFSHHAYSFPYTALENNPVYPKRASGNLLNLFEDRLRRARSWAHGPTERKVSGGEVRTVVIAGEVDEGLEVGAIEQMQAGGRCFLLHQGSAATLPLPDRSVDHIVTDPPYFDSVQYSDLAGFFRVWLKQLLPDQARWEYDLSGAAVDPGGNNDGQYVKVLTGVFKECRRVLKDRGLLVFTFHHWDAKGWAGLTLALKRAGFGLVQRYVVHSENPVSVHIANMRALTHDAILVLAPAERVKQCWDVPVRIRATDSYDFVRDCATALGALLDVDKSEEEIVETWTRLLRTL